jgi:BirA family biotin operon repressor/biotin-[acetyl-CoA-carboxylase] ligase
MSLSIPELVAMLADGRFHTGDALGQHFGVSKTIIWREIGKLSALGLDVHSVRGKGYRLSEPLTLLNDQDIRAGLPASTQAGLHAIELLHTIDSTNSHAMRLLQTNALVLNAGQSWVCLAEQQTAGRGRRGREWVSPFGANLYMTVVRSFSGGAHMLDGLSLVTGLALVEALQQCGVSGLGLKWPNDLLFGNEKLAGILVEITGDVTGSFQVVIGIGVNLVSKPAAMQSVSQPWTALEVLGVDRSIRNRLAGAILQHLLCSLDQFEQHGFGIFRERWHAFDVSRDRDLELLTAAGSVFGRSLGVDEKGALVLHTDNGVETFHGGEVSLRRMPA